MLFRVKNLGLIDEAEIKLDGITVITGENNVGKSTIGKMLYCVNNVFLYGNVEEVKIRRIERVIINFFSETDYLLSMRIRKKIIERVQESDFIHSLVYDDKALNLRDDLERLLEDLIANDKGSTEQVQEDLVCSLQERVLEVLNMDDVQIHLGLVGIAVGSNFSSVTHNVYGKNDLTEIDLKLAESEQHIRISVDEVFFVDYSKDIVLAEAIYIESPRVAQDEEKNLIDFNFDRRQRLLKMLVEESDADFWETKETKLEIKNILDKVSALAPGNLVKKDSYSNKLEYEEEGRRFDLINVSNGVKTFAILKKLLINAKLKRNSMLILDEPEIHLHPDWQLVFAEVLVLLQKQFKLKILINTHSTFFLMALEDCSEMYKIVENCNYYLIERNGNHSVCHDHTDSLNKIYMHFANAYDELENLRCDDDQ